jgi:putative FmdB family regulatory protein
MPIYEYRCSDCGHELEALQKISEAPLTLCPACGHSALTKKVSAAGFQLKGTGWYVTDFRNGSKPAAKNANGDAAKSDGAEKGEAKSDKSDGKSETKSDAKSETKSDAKSSETKTTAPASSGTTST